MDENREGMTTTETEWILYGLKCTVGQRMIICFTLVAVLHTPSTPPPCCPLLPFLHNLLRHPHLLSSLPSNVGDVRVFSNSERYYFAFSYLKQVHTNYASFHYCPISHTQPHHFILPPTLKPSLTLPPFSPPLSFILLWNLSLYHPSSTTHVILTWLPRPSLYSLIPHQSYFFTFSRPPFPLPLNSQVKVMLCSV